MALADDLKNEVVRTFATDWNEEIATVVPTAENLRLNSNHAKRLDPATVLYADLDSSTSMVDTLAWQQSAEIYKGYLRCASMIIKQEGGTITAYDGDRVMAVFTGTSKNTTAVRTAMKINRAVIEIVRPAYKAQYPDSDFEIKHSIGIDTSILRASRIGVRGDNDIVWVGRAANYAAKLTALSAKPIWITSTVYDAMDGRTKYVSGTEASPNMWTPYTWNTFNDARIYGTHYMWHEI